MSPRLATLSTPTPICPQDTELCSDYFVDLENENDLQYFSPFLLSPLVGSFKLTPANRATRKSIWKKEKKSQKKGEKIHLTELKQLYSDGRQGKVEKKKNRSQGKLRETDSLVSHVELSPDCVFDLENEDDLQFLSPLECSIKLTPADRAKLKTILRKERKEEILPLTELEQLPLDCRQGKVEKKKQSSREKLQTTKLPRRRATALVNPDPEYVSFLEEKLRELEVEKSCGLAGNGTYDEKYEKEVEALREKCLRLEKMYAKSQKDLDDHVQNNLKEQKQIYRAVEASLKKKDEMVEFYKSEAKRSKMEVEKYKNELKDIRTAKNRQKKVGFLPVKA